eukprot:11978087-Alexandrium_andersonii.AAC.1
MRSREQRTAQAECSPRKALPSRPAGHSGNTIADSWSLGVGHQAPRERVICSNGCASKQPRGRA